MAFEALTVVLVTFQVF